MVDIVPEMRPRVPVALGQCHLASDKTAAIKHDTRYEKRHMRNDLCLHFHMPIFVSDLLLVSQAK